jgi:hypothetical protein
MRVDPPSGYLLNYITVQGEMIEMVHGLVAQEGPLTLQEVRSLIGRAQTDGIDDLKRTLDWLHQVGAVVLDDQDGYESTVGVVSRAELSLAIFHHLWTAKENRRDPLTIHAHLVKDGLWSANDDSVIAHLNRKGFQTPGEAELNTNKIRKWALLYGYLGLFYKVPNSTDIYLMPAPEVLLGTLESAGAGERNITLVEWIRHVEQTYFAVIDEREQRLSIGVAQQLLRLHGEGRIKLQVKDDAQAISLGEQTFSHVQLVQEEA